MALGVAALVVAAAVVVMGADGDDDESKAAPRLRWLAVGDSYSSGLGVPIVDGDTGCQRSADAWGYRVDARLRELGYRTKFQLLACSGATVPDLSRARPGEVSQLEAIRRANPDFVTITIGGNDLGFVRQFVECGLLKDCFEKAPVFESPDAAMAELQPRLVALYREIQETLPSPDRLVVVAYPHVTAAADRFSGSDTACAVLSRSGSDLLHRARDLVAEFLEDVATETGATFIDGALAALDGHELCAGRKSNWWINGVSIEFGTFPPSLSVKPQSLHPNDEGQEALARVITPIVDGVLRDAG